MAEEAEEDVEALAEAVEAYLQAQARATTPTSKTRILMQPYRGIAPWKQAI
jgi:hypothetical protein